MSIVSLSALALVLVAAVVHAVWNLHAKRIGSASLLVAWASSTVATAVYAPLMAWELSTGGHAVEPAAAWLILGSAVLHTAYFLVLQRSYTIGDLSLVYPIARGVGPLLAVLGGVLLLGERPTPRVLGGGLVVGAGVVGLGLLGSAMGARARRGDWSSAGPALLFAGLTGTAIAAYTVWDAHAVRAAGIPPVLFSWAGSATRCVALMPLAWWRRQRLRSVWREHRSAIVAVATLSPLAYILVLVALTLAPVSAVAPTRELSIVIGAALGAKLLGEGQRLARLAGASTVLVGVVLLATA